MTRILSPFSRGARRRGFRRCSRIPAHCITLSVLLFLCQPLHAQSKPSSAAALSASAEDSLENQSLVPDSSDSAAKPIPIVAPSASFDTTRVVLALAGVLGLIFVLRAGAKRIFPGAAAARATSAVKVLARCTISPKQHLLVIQFGKRLVLVGDTGSHLNPLCEIADADEAASVLAQARDESITAARRFDSLFGRARGGFAQAPSPDSEERFDESHEINADAPPVVDDPALEATRKELAGLSHKVRDVARQLGRA
ncbi:MAG TPA: flagellar biosynthetic protein FliO [Tepidisphaeraceae bacterium]|nr:flagellar biosynthetic protein FliO [Tepidisphaeraceae bacterium]